MSGPKQKSKKPSVASSRQLPDLTFYLDRNLGKHTVADALRAAGVIVQLHDDHLPIDAPDESWIRLVGERGWIAITKDRNIRYRIAEISSVKRNRARVLVIRAKNATGAEIGEILIDALPAIQRLVGTPGPLIAGIYRGGRVVSYEW